MSALARRPNRQTIIADDDLTAKHRLVVEYMLHGVAHPSLCERAQIVDRYDPGTGEPILRHPKVGEPLDLIAAADVLHMKRRLARALSKQPAFQRLLASETQAFRDGSRARAVRRMVTLIDEPGEGRAADRKVQLAASMATLGEAGNTTNISVNTGTQVTAGVVVLRHSDPDDEPETRTIEHAA